MNMNPQQLKQLMSGVSANLMADLKDKLKQLIRQNGGSTRAFMEKYNISGDDFDSILDGRNTVSVQTFIKILILSGHVIEVKDLKSQLQGAPVPPPPSAGHFVPRFPQGGFRHAPKPGPAIPVPSRVNKPKTEVPEEWHNFDEDIIDDEIEEHYGDHPGTIEFDHDEFDEPNETQGTPSFERMSRNQLVEIIEDKLWSSEIDTEDATKDELVDFLYKKDDLHRQVEEKKRRQQVAQRHIDEDEALDALQSRLAAAVKRNPHLKDSVERLLNSANRF